MQVIEHRKRFLRNFYPIAFLLSLFLLAFTVPIMVPASLLHLGLWLRYPRIRQHYWTFIALMAVPVVLYIVLPLIGNSIYARDGNRPESLVDMGHLSDMIIMLAGSGVVPILYRFFSTSAFGPATSENHNLKPPRASIVDSQALILLCAIVFLGFKLNGFTYRDDYSPVWPLIATLVVSLVAIVAMRLNARCSNSQMIANFAVIWIGGWMLLIVTLFGLDSLVHPAGKHLNRFATPENDWLFIQSRTRWEKLTSGFSMLSIAVFPIICRRCGWVLAPIHDANQTADSRDGTAAWKGKLAGQLSLLVIIGLLTLYPFTWTTEYKAEGYRVAGWPLVYWHAEQTSSSSAKWYWTDSSIWQSIDFNLPVLIIDILLTLVAWLVILPPAPLRRRVSARSIVVARGALAVAFLFAVSWSMFLSTMYSDYQLKRSGHVTVDEYFDDGDFPLFQRIAYELDKKWRAKEAQFQQGKPARITIHDASTDEVDAVLQRLPKLNSLTLENCDLSPDRVAELAADERLDVFRYFNDDLGECGGFEIDRQRYGVAKTYELKLTSCGGDFFIPKGVESLQLIVSKLGDSKFELSGMEDLDRLQVHSTFSDRGDSVCQIRVKEAPNLNSMRFDSRQKYALDIEKAPNLLRIDSIWDASAFTGVRLTQLNIGGLTGPAAFCLNLTDLTNVRLKGATEFFDVMQLCLWMDSNENTQLTVDEVQQRFKKLSPIRSADNVELNGMVCNDAILRDLPYVRKALILNHCTFLDDVTKQSYERFTGIPDLTVENLAATTQQINELTDCALNTIVADSHNELQVDAVITTPPRLMIDASDWFFNSYYKLGKYISRLTQEAQDSSRPGTLTLQISDLDFLAPNAQALFDDARDAGVTVKINP